MYLCGIGLLSYDCGLSGLLTVVYAFTAGFVVLFFSLLNSPQPCTTPLGACRTSSEGWMSRAAAGRAERSTIACRIANAAPRVRPSKPSSSDPGRPSSSKHLPSRSTRRRSLLYYSS